MSVVEDDFEIDFPFTLTCIKDNLKVYTNIERDQMKIKVIAQTSDEAIDIFETCLSCAENVGILSQYFDYLQQIRYFLRDPSNTIININQGMMRLVIHENKEKIQIIKLPLSKSISKTKKQQQQLILQSNMKNNDVKEKANLQHTIVCDCMSQFKKDIMLYLNSLKTEMRQHQQQNMKLLTGLMAEISRLNNFKFGQTAYSFDICSPYVNQKVQELQQTDIICKIQQIKKINEIIKGLSNTENSLKNIIFNKILEKEQKLPQTTGESILNSPNKQKQQQKTKLISEQMNMIGKNREIQTAVVKNQINARSLIERQNTQRQCKKQSNLE